MRLTSIIFLLIATAALFLADISITTFDPWQELGQIAGGFVTPDFFSLRFYGSALLNTISFALVGIAAAVVLGALLALFFDHTAVRLFAAFIRSIHEIFWAFLLMPIVGLNSLCGILAITIPFAGVFGKVFAEIYQEADPEPAKALPPSSSRISRFIYGELPIIYGDLKNYTSYRFECALRSSAVLGFIGLPTLGYHLETAFREAMYSEAAALLYLFYLLILSLRFWVKPTTVLPVLLVAVLFTSWETSFSLSNVVRFFTYDILPWPMRAEGFYNGSNIIHFQIVPLLQWLYDIVVSMAIPGAVNTLILTQVALVCTAIFTLVVFPFASRKFYSQKVTAPFQLLLVILRTTPEYILAYMFLQLWGPSMLPAVFALFLHNGAILAHLSSLNVNLMSLPFDTTKQRVNRYLYEVLPRSYGQFLAFLFYRWEVIMRESAILGILGVYTLGHYIDSAISEDHLDVAILLILITALINILIDTLSQLIRRKLRLSVTLVTKS